MEQLLPLLAKLNIANNTLKSNVSFLLYGDVFLVLPLKFFLLLIIQYISLAFSFLPPGGHKLADFKCMHYHKLRSVLDHCLHLSKEASRASDLGQWHNCLPGKHEVMSSIPSTKKKKKKKEAKPNFSKKIKSMKQYFA